MTFISYAQNFEDVILWRALKQVEHGFYIDVGAQDPIVDSVSLAFYEQGWRGLHVEPNADYAGKLRDARPDETVIEKAIGAEAGKIAFWEFPDTGLSTGVHALADKHQSDGRKSRKTEVPCIPLSAVLDRCHDREVHWLKIDVEGMERSVIESWSPSVVRPWIVLVESTRPNSQEESFAEWQPSLIGLGYEFVYFDGVNRFYVSVEHSELKRFFGPGPNFFDSFMLSATSSYCHAIHLELQARLATYDTKVGTLGQALATIQSENEMLSTRLDQSSPTWRMTAPLRKLARAASRRSKRDPGATLLSRLRRKRRPEKLATQPGRPSPSRDENQTLPGTEAHAVLADAMRGWSLGKRLDA